MILTAHAFLRDHPHPSRDDIRRAIAGNLCRCTGYTKIVDAIVAAAGKTPVAHG
jgi:aerobic-type carbon monoxide dehydrogenase small subunit (CoxS/CutS family)